MVYFGNLPFSPYLTMTRLKMSEIIFTGCTPPPQKKKKKKNLCVDNIFGRSVFRNELGKVISKRYLASVAYKSENLAFCRQFRYA